jgi:hypothetical protein
MSELIMRFPEDVSGAGGTFSTCVMGRDRGDGEWEAWLEFAPTPSGLAVLVTGTETHQHTRVALERWASGLSRVYAEGALARARERHAQTPSLELLAALHEIVEALDRRLPQVERASESNIAADAKRLRAGAVERMAILRRELAALSQARVTDAGGDKPPAKVTTCS